MHAGSFVGVTEVQKNFSLFIVIGSSGMHGCFKGEDIILKTTDSKYDDLKSHTIATV